MTFHKRYMLYFGTIKKHPISNDLNTNYEKPLNPFIAITNYRLSKK